MNNQAIIIFTLVYMPIDDGYGSIHILYMMLIHEIHVLISHIHYLLYIYKITKVVDALLFLIYLRIWHPVK